MKIYQEDGEKGEKVDYKKTMAHIEILKTALENLQQHEVPIHTF